MRVFICQNCETVFEPPCKEIDEEEIEDKINYRLDCCPYCNPEAFYPPSENS